MRTTISKVVVWGGCAAASLAVLAPLKPANAEVFNLGGAGKTGPSSLVYTVNGINLTFQDPIGSNTPVVMRNTNGVCAGMTFTDLQGLTTSPFCGQNATSATSMDAVGLSPAYPLPNNQQLSTISFKFDRDVTLKSFTVAAADFQNPNSGNFANQVGTGTVIFKPQFDNADSGTFIPGDDLVMNVQRDALPATVTFLNTSATGACTDTGGGTPAGSRCTVDFSNNYFVKAGTLVTVSTPEFAGTSTEGYGTISSANYHWRLFALETEVPGPLPLMGGAAAFGWSRKLRSRIKSTKKNIVVSDV